MKKSYLLILCLLLVISLAGCARTYTYQVERKDQVLRGNRGVMMGEIPESELDRKRTRTMLGIDVILPPSEEYKARKEALEEKLVRERVIIEEEIIEEEPVARLEAEEGLEEFIAEEVIEEVEEEYQPREITYTIQKGDTLQKISKRFYGTTRKWPGIYEANKDTIKESSRVYPGQVIVIPPAEVTEEKLESEYK